MVAFRSSTASMGLKYVSFIKLILHFKSSIVVGQPDQQQRRRKFNRQLFFFLPTEKCAMMPMLKFHWRISAVDGSPTAKDGKPSSFEGLR